MGDPLKAAGQAGSFLPGSLLHPPLETGSTTSFVSHGPEEAVAARKKETKYLTKHDDGSFDAEKVRALDRKMPPVHSLYSHGARSTQRRHEVVEALISSDRTTLDRVRGEIGKTYNMIGRFDKSSAMGRHADRLETFGMMASFGSFSPALPIVPLAAGLAVGAKKDIGRDQKTLQMIHENLPSLY